MRVFVWAGGHTIAETLVQNPPDSVEVVSNVQTYTKKTGVSGERMFVMPHEAKLILDRAVYSTGLPRFLPSAPRVDLIHTVSGLVPLVPRPWITSISMPSSFFGLHDDWYESRRRFWTLRKILRSNGCRCVTCFSQSTLDGLKSILGKHMDHTIESKLEVLYPAIDRRRFTHKKKDGDQFRILFVGNHFFDKGGRELHRAVSRLAGKYDIQLDIVTDAPPHHKDALEEFVKKHQEKWAKWYIPGLSRRQLIDEFYPAADLFVMCSYMEVFGFVHIEAMASGLPIIGANVYAQREIVSDGENGYLIDVPITPFEGSPQLRTQQSVERYRRAILNESLFDPVVDQLAEKIELLIQDRGIRERMSRNSVKMTTDGKFGLQARNRRLKEIYSSALEQQ
jgi:glycosyltransferase involved in cell wall biosynthesis